MAMHHSIQGLLQVKSKSYLAASTTLDYHCHVIALYFSVRRQGIDVEGRETFGMVYKLGLRMYRLYVTIEGEYYYKNLNARLENELM